MQHRDGREYQEGTVSPRIAPYRERIQIDIPIVIAHLNRKDGFRRVAQAGDSAVVVVDLAASRADITISISKGFGPPEMVVTGPWLTGRRNEGIVRDILQIANDALQSGRTMAALDVIAQALTAKNGSVTTGSVIRPIIIPVRQNWQIDVKLNEGAEEGPVDLWVRTLETRDINR